MKGKRSWRDLSTLPRSWRTLLKGEEGRSGAHREWGSTAQRGGGGKMFLRKKGKEKGEIWQPL